MKFLNSKNKRTLVLLAVVLLIVGSIGYLESQKTDTADVHVEELVAEQLVEEPEQVDAQTLAANQARIAQKEGQYRRAIELVSPDGYINTEPFTLADVIGEKVVLIDFWTYSCINCQRTIPYLQQWWESYEDDGLLIVGVHTPEFAFEKERDNVVQAAEQFGVSWPIVQDNNKQSFRAYENRYWPRKYLIDIDGFIVYDKIGEGAYPETEAKIVEALEERKEVLGLDLQVESADLDEVEPQTHFGQARTPEIYFGYFRAAGYIGGVSVIIPDVVTNYEVPEMRVPHKFYLDGNWLHERERVVAQEDARILLDYRAKIVNIVAGSEEPVDMDVYVDGEFVQTVTVQDSTLYEVFADDAYNERSLELHVPAGFEAFTFTFG